MERPQCAYQNANDDNAAEDSEALLFPHCLPPFVHQPRLRGNGRFTRPNRALPDLTKLRPLES
jgi:hypothetical protein